MTIIKKIQNKLINEFIELGIHSSRDLKQVEPDLMQDYVILTLRPHGLKLKQVESIMRFLGIKKIEVDNKLIIEI